MTVQRIFKFKFGHLKLKTNQQTGTFIMNYPDLSRGNRGKAVKELQLFLNRVGSMLIVDGDFGRATERGVLYAQDIAKKPSTGVVKKALWSWLESKSDPFPKLETNGVAFIAAEETGGLSYYNAITRYPHFPGLSSGVTIGVGYDLRYNSKANFQQLWGNYLSQKIIDELSKDIGKRGTKKRIKELRNLGIEIPFKSAWPVFIEETLPRFYNMTNSIYPSLAELPNMCRSTLVSLVYNRGSSLSGSRRIEMRAIRDILSDAAKPNLNKQERKEILVGIEDQLISMQRLWGMGSGVYKRRQSEANLWRNGLRQI